MHLLQRIAIYVLTIWIAYYISILSSWQTWLSRWQQVWYTQVVKSLSFANLIIHFRQRTLKNNCGLTVWIYVCLFRFLFFFGVNRPTREFFIIWRRHHCRWRAANFDLCSALMAIEQWGFFSVPHLLLHGASVCNGRLRGPLTPSPSVWQWSCHYLFLRTPISRIRGERSTSTPSRRFKNKLKQIKPYDLILYRSKNIQTKEF